MTDNPKHVTVRLRVPPELRDKIAESAKEHNRSMNADMVSRLDESFGQTYIAIKHVKTEILLAVLAEKFAKQDCEVRIVKSVKVEDSAKPTEFSSLAKEDK